MDRGYILGVIVGFLGGIMVLLLVLEGYKIESNHPITPKLQIEVVDGVADTTYIYTKPEGE